MALPHYDLIDLTVFLTLARTRSLTAAAEELPFTASALSLRLKKLEGALGVPLFLRQSRGLALTPAGEALKRHAQAVLGQASILETAMAGYQKAERTLLRIASNSAGLENFLAPAAPSFLSGRNIRLSFHERRSSEGASDALSGACDLALGLEAVFRLKEPLLEVIPFCSDRHVVIVPEAHPLASRTEISYAETLEYPYVATLDGQPFTRAMASRAEALGHVYSPIVQLPSFALLIRIVAAGAGLAVVPASSLKDSVGVRAIRLVDPWAERRLAFAVPSEGPHSALAREFALHCRSLFQQKEA